MPTIKTFYKDEVTIECTWGDGPDILMDITRQIGKHSEEAFNFDLKASEAREIARALLLAADQSDEMERLAKENFDRIWPEED